MAVQGDAQGDAQGDTWWSRLQMHESERVLGALEDLLPGEWWWLGEQAGRRVDRERLARVLLEATSSAWRRGWQPADLVNLARRQLTAAHVELLRRAIGVELSAYPPSTIDPRWRPQLEDLGVRVAPAADISWTDVDGGDAPWLGAVAVCVELVRFLGTLVGVERLTALPGSAGSGGRRAAHDVDLRVLARVRALLAKAESTSFPAEAETFTAGAQALMARHSIDEALLAAQDALPGPEPAGIRVWIEGPYESAKVTLLFAVAEANRCRTVWRKAYGSCTVVGFETDLAAVDALFTSLLVQATHAMTREGARVDSRGRSRTRAFRQSFLLAFAQRIGERLATAARAAQDDAVRETGGNRLLPVLAARTAEVDRVMAEMFPPLRTSRSRVTAWDGEGWASGRAAADRAVLGVRGSLPA